MPQRFCMDRIDEADLWERKGRAKRDEAGRLHWTIARTDDYALRYYYAGRFCSLYSQAYGEWRAIGMNRDVGQALAWFDTFIAGRELRSSGGIPCGS